MSSILIGYDKAGNTEVTVKMKVTITVPSDWGLFGDELRRKGLDGGDTVRFNLDIIADELRTALTETVVDDTYPWHVSAVEAA